MPRPDADEAAARRIQEERDLCDAYREVFGSPAGARVFAHLRYVAQGKTGQVSEAERAGRAAIILTILEWRDRVPQGGGQ